MKQIKVAVESGPRESVIDGPLSDVLVILKVIIEYCPGIKYTKIWSGGQLPNKKELLVASINLEHTLPLYILQINSNLNILVVKCRKIHD